MHPEKVAKVTLKVQLSGFGSLSMNSILYPLQCTFQVFNLTCPDFLVVVYYFLTVPLVLTELYSILEEKNHHFRDWKEFYQNPGTMLIQHQYT